ncbi:hypothetical protein [Cupriavidus sp. D39]|uniref:hypothetical protein n=1 Tax=Cupriavidus sp. D39 TaxID=2997877 RepID=UPI00226F5F57|nr:hypothetical protein [Cupriavidus sp. D39]MCY0853297.1 hypothetical protein [Cupriavidus sp. D39]
MEPNDDAFHREPADHGNRNALLETALDDFLQRVHSLSGASLQQAKQDLLKTVVGVNSVGSIAERWGIG